MCEVRKEDRLDGQEYYFVAPCRFGYDIAHSVLHTYYVCKDGDRIVRKLSLPVWGVTRKNA